MDTKPSSTTSVSLAVRERRHTDETRAEKLYKDIISRCLQVIDRSLMYSFFDYSVSLAKHTFCG